MRHLPLFGVLTAAVLHGQNYAPRANFGARLEPQGVLMHGAGQDSVSYSGYWSVMPVGSQPTIYMYYIGLDTLTPNWADALKAQLLTYPGNFVIPQIGLSMTDSPANHYEAQVAAGMYDAQIGYLISGLRELATPVYLRIGYEFNGLNWNGYLPAPYVQAFQHVTNLLRAAPDVEAATVWDASADGVTNVSDYYPGDSYVDWFGMNLFPDTDFSASILSAFMSMSTAHSKPVMVGESTPENVGAQSGAASWTGWYADYFKFLQTNSQVKQFNYIDSNWAAAAVADNQPSWANWGDSRLELPTAAYVRNLYIAQLANPIVFSSTTNESTFRRLLGYNTTTPPAAPSGFTAASAPGGVALTWNAVADPSGIARYYLYRNNTLLDFSLASPYTDLSVGLGSNTYSITAMDRAGNVSAAASQTVNLSQIQRIQNGGFENGLTGWQFNSYASGAVGTAVVDTANPIDGASSVRINVAGTTGTNWNLQLLQDFTMTAGLTYTVSFKARSSAPISFPFAIQQVVSPNAVYLEPNISVTTTAATYEYSFTATVTQMVDITFYVDNIGSATLWLDDISVQESNTGSNPPPNLLASGVQSGASYLPGVVPGSWLAIKGANLSTIASDTWANSIVAGALPTTLDGVSVSIGGLPASIYYVSPGQINVIAPNLSPGATTLTVTTPAGTTMPVTVNVASAAPAFFLWPGNQAVATRTDGSFVAKPGTFAGAATTAAHPGDIVILWGTGFGATTPPAPQGTVVPSTQQYSCSPVTAALGAANLTVYGCALSPGSAGLYQVAVQIPATIANGDYALAVTVSGAVSPPGVVLSVSN
jgi:uncharacterized protein (TIGR03437 family)